MVGYQSGGSYNILCYPKIISCYLLLSSVTSCYLLLSSVIVFRIISSYSTSVSMCVKKFIGIGQKDIHLSVEVFRVYSLGIANGPNVRVNFIRGKY